MPQNDKNDKEKAKASSGRLIKYMGASDRRIIAKGENFGGQLAEPVAADVVWDWDNNHVVDVAEAGLSADAIDLLLDIDLADPVITNPKTGKPVDVGGVSYPQGSKEFRDVTDLSRHPVNLASSIWKGVRELNESHVQSISPTGVATSSGGAGSADISGTASTGTPGGGAGTSGT